jgi:hypothetical protein
MKSCSHPTCTYPVFSHSYCQNHQYMRTDRKKPQRSILKHSEKKPAHTIDWGFESQTELFLWLWGDAENERGEVYCPYTGEKLNRFFNTELWFSCFAHVLPKGRYTYWKLNPKNLRVVLPDFHFCVDQQTREIRKNHPEWNFSLWDKETEELKIEYLLFKKSNLLA